MTTTASKLYYGAAVLAFVAACAYSYGTGGGLEGPLFLGLKGGVGDIAGYLVLVSVAFVAFGLGVATSILRDADPEAAAAAARLETLPEALPPAGLSYWPVVGAGAVVAAAVGLVASPVLFVIGAIVAGLVVLEWMVQAWSERATGDPAVNRRIRNRLMYPIEIPVAGALVIVVVVVCFSRVLLAASEHGSAIIAIVVATVVLAAAFVIAYRPSVSRDAVAVLLVLGALAVIAGGIIAAEHGTRTFEHEGGLAPPPAVTVLSSESAS